MKKVFEAIVQSDCGLDPIVTMLSGKSHLQVLAAVNKGLEVLNKLLLGQLLAVVPLHKLTIGKLLRWDENVADNVDDTILGNTITDGHASETVNLDLNEAAVTSDVNAETAVFKESRQVNVEKTLRGSTSGATVLAVVLALATLVVLAAGVFGLLVLLVVGITVKGLVGHDVVLQECLEVLLSVLAEKESIDPRAEFLECKVGRSKESTTGVVGVVQRFEETGLDESELKGGELAGKEIDNLESLRRWDDDVVNTVDDTVGTKLFKNVSGYTK